MNNQCLKITNVTETMLEYIDGLVPSNGTPGSDYEQARYGFHYLMCALVKNFHEGEDMKAILIEGLDAGVARSLQGEYQMRLDVTYDVIFSNGYTAWSVEVGTTMGDVESCYAKKKDITGADMVLIVRICDTPQVIGDLNYMKNMGMITEDTINHMKGSALEFYEKLINVYDRDFLERGSGVAIPLRDPFEAYRCTKDTVRESIPIETVRKVSEKVMSKDAFIWEKPRYPKVMCNRAKREYAHIPLPFLSTGINMDRGNGEVSIGECLRLFVSQIDDFEMVRIGRKDPSSEASAEEQAFLTVECVLKAFQNIAWEGDYFTHTELDKKAMKHLFRIGVKPPKPTEAEKKEATTFDDPKHKHGCSNLIDWIYKEGTSIPPGKVKLDGTLDCLIAGEDMIYEDVKDLMEWAFSTRWGSAIRAAQIIATKLIAGSSVGPRTVSLNKMTTAGNKDILLYPIAGETKVTDVDGENRITNMLFGIIVRGIVHVQSGGRGSDLPYVSIGIDKEEPPFYEDWTVIRCYLGSIEDGGEPVYLSIKRTQSCVEYLSHLSSVSHVFCELATEASLYAQSTGVPRRVMEMLGPDMDHYTEEKEHFLHFLTNVFVKIILNSPSAEECSGACLIYHKMWESSLKGADGFVLGGKDLAEKVEKNCQDILSEFQADVVRSMLIESGLANKSEIDDFNEPRWYEPTFQGEVEDDIVYYDGLRRIAWTPPTNPAYGLD